MNIYANSGDMSTSRKSSSKRVYHSHKISWKDSALSVCLLQKNGNSLSPRKKPLSRVPSIACFQLPQSRANSWLDFNSSGIHPMYPRSYRNSTAKRLEYTQNYYSSTISINTDVSSWTTTTNTLVAANRHAIYAMRTSRTIPGSTRSLRPTKSFTSDGGIRISTPVIQLVRHGRRKSC